MKSFINNGILGSALLGIFLHCPLSFSTGEEPLLSFDTWQKRIQAAPKMLTQRDLREKITTSLISKNDFRQVYADFLAVMQAGSTQSQAKNWLNKKDGSSLFVSKISVDPDAAVIFHGDIHGDIHSLMMLLKVLQTFGYLSQDDGFSIKDKYKDSFNMVFLGDYVDRGWYGLEVLYTLMRLKIANPDNVFLLRGNHEDWRVNSRYGFQQELVAKNFAEEDVIRALNKLYGYLPSALFLAVEGPTGKDVLQCNHGGLELGFNSKPLIATKQAQAFQWISHIARETPSIDAIPSIKSPSISKESPVMRYLGFSGRPDPLQIGFLWNDFIVNPRTALDQEISFTQGRGLTTGKDVTMRILRQNSTPKARIRGVIRAHQHSASETPMMSMLLLQPDERQNLGLARLWKDTSNAHLSPEKLWDGIVCTLNVSPFTPYGIMQRLGPFEFDTFALLMLDKKFENWKLQVHRTYPNKSGRERFPTFIQFKETTKSFLQKKQKKLKKKLLELYINDYDKLSNQLLELAQIEQ